MADLPEAYVHLPPLASTRYRSIRYLKRIGRGIAFFCWLAGLIPIATFCILILACTPRYQSLHRYEG